MLVHDIRIGHFSQERSTFKIRGNEGVENRKAPFCVCVHFRCAGSILQHDRKRNSALASFLHPPFSFCCCCLSTPGLGNLAKNPWKVYGTGKLENSPVFPVGSHSCLDEFLRPEVRGKRGYKN